MLDVNHGVEFVGGAVARPLPFVAVVGLLVARIKLAPVEAHPQARGKMIKHLGSRFLLVSGALHIEVASTFPSYNKTQKYTAEVQACFLINVFNSSYDTGNTPFLHSCYALSYGLLQI